MMRKLLFTVLSCLMVSCQADNTLKVMSFNVRTSVKDDGDNSWDLRKEASVAMLEESCPDIFGVQEAQPDQLAYIAGECPDYVPFGVGRDKGDDEGEHASIFYNRHVLEMVDGGTWWLSETPDVPSVGWDAKYPRTATWALMKDLRNGKRFYFVNTHLDHKGIAARRNGLAMVMHKTRGLNPDIPLVLMGDFNVEPSDSCLVDIDRDMLSARAVAAQTTDKPSFNGFKTPASKTIDYIYFAGFEKALAFDVLDKSYAGKPYISDHYPIVATIAY